MFVDGLGLGPEDSAFNPVSHRICPTLFQLLKDCAVPIDATLGVPGLPQSATGQTTLLTGHNAARIAGRHVEAYPPERLRVIVREHSVFQRMKSLGLRSTFANGYYLHDVSTMEHLRTQSVTTVATLSAFGAVRDRKWLEGNRAVYHDITRESLRSRGYDGPLIRPEEAAQHLIEIAEAQHLTLFEYFLTDRAGHSGSFAEAERVLRLLDAFLRRLLELADQAGITIILTSDHGNIEDLRVKSHTLNPIPFAITNGAGISVFPRIRSLLDVVPALLSLWQAADVVPDLDREQAAG